MATEIRVGKRQRQSNRKFMDPPDSPFNQEVKKTTSAKKKTISAKKHKANQGLQEDAKIVVGIDFGTTFSGFAYALAISPESVYDVDQWPDKAEARAPSYCKTQTSLWYLPGKNGTFELKSWGWSAQVNHLKFLPATDTLDEKPWLKCFSHEFRPTAPVFFSKFKLKLGPDELQSGVNSEREQFAEGFSVEKLISDYLRQLSSFIMAKLKNHFGSHAQKKDIRWCLTLPSIWTETAKQIMIDCAQRAGLVRGRLCPDGEDASLHDIEIVLEPEAAAIYCQQKLMDIMQFRQGSKFLVVDAGGGTVDLVVHQKVSNSDLRMQEVTISTGELCGSTYVDDACYEYLGKRIACFYDFLNQYPREMYVLKAHWEDVKNAFDAEEEKYILPLTPKFVRFWKDYDNKRCGSWTADSQNDDIVITREDMCMIFDGPVNKILKLIKDQLDQAPGVEAIMVVGGFAKSQYLMNRIRDKFSLQVKHIVSPPEPGSAVCKGAVALGALGADLVRSRMSRKTYGIDHMREFREGDPPGSMLVGDNGVNLCKDVFDVFTRIGDDVPVDHYVTHEFWPFKKGEREIRFTMYATTDPSPAFVTDSGVVEVASWRYKLPPKARKMEGEEARLKVTMYFGRTHIKVSAQHHERLGGGKTSMLSVPFERQVSHRTLQGRLDAMEDKAKLLQSIQAGATFIIPLESEANPQRISTKANTEKPAVRATDQVEGGKQKHKTALEVQNQKDIQVPQGSGGSWFGFRSKPKERKLSE